MYSTCLWLVSCVMNFEYEYFLRIFILFMFGFSISIHDSIVCFLKLLMILSYVICLVLLNIDESELCCLFYAFCLLTDLWSLCSALYPILIMCIVIRGG